MGNAGPCAVFQQVDGGAPAAAQQERVALHPDVAVEPVVPCSDDGGHGAAFDQRQQLLIFRAVG